MLAAGGRRLVSPAGAYNGHMASFRTARWAWDAFAEPFAHSCTARGKRFTHLDFFLPSGPLSYSTTIFAKLFLLVIVRSLWSHKTNPEIPEELPPAAASSCVG